MTALTQDRNTPRLEGGVYEAGVAAATKLFGGSLGCFNAAGYLVPGSTSTTLKAAGRIEKQVDNSGGAAGAKSAKYRPGIYRFANSASADLITIADVANDCYIVDDQTVAKTHATNTRSIAGKIVMVDSLGVWVKVGID
ncbi:hypothetical protein SAMN05892877_12375 [Rhizobium subbaraonis]|uniref:Uncharacterized protein n=1 Tax=Rhizobium subbaraonis TaxID=908946 RepID=A0A285UXV7_9HYPH|nr:hypothetical protein [Rhizobium subbaraonis]SOC46650.1 hypothetical protein SAMN05892877_12375 [Rhizobium subbaraonis]